MIPVYQTRRNGTALKKYNTLINTTSYPAALITTLKLRKKTDNLKNLYQYTSQNLRWLGFISAVFSLLGISLIYYETELLYYEKLELTEKINTIRSVILFICLFHSANTLFIHMLIEEKFFMNYTKNFYNLFKDLNRLKHLLLDIFICMIHTPPGLSLSFTVTQLGFESHLSSSDILFPLSLLKLKFPLLFIAQVSFESYHKSKVISIFFGSENNLSFIIKTLIHRHTFSAFLLVFWSSLFIFGVSFRVYEKNSLQGSFWDYIWLSFTTESTVGYGDYFPKTHIGRLISGFSSVLGVFVLSYSVTAVRNLTSLSSVEMKLSKKILYNKKVRNTLGPLAAAFISKAWKSRSVQKKFELAELSKKFAFTRKKLISNLHVDFEQQLEDSGQIMSKFIEHSLSIFNNVEEVQLKGKTLITSCLSSFKSLVSLMDKQGVFEQFQENKVRKSSYLIVPDINRIRRKRKNAVKKLLIRKAISSGSDLSNSISSIDS